MKNWPFPLVVVYISIDQINLSNHGRGSPNDHLDQSFSNQASRNRMFFFKVFPFDCHGNQNSEWNGTLNNFDRVTAKKSKDHSCEVF